MDKQKEISTEYLLEKGRQRNHVHLAKKIMGEEQQIDEQQDFDKDINVLNKDDAEINVGMIENALKCLAGQKPCNLCVYDDRSMQDGERSCINLVAEDTLDLIHRLQEHNGNEVRMRCDTQKKFDDLQNLCIEQKAEIERLTKQSGKHIIDCDYWKNMHDVLVGSYNKLKDENTKLQKQVDELKEEMRKIEKDKDKLSTHKLTTIDEILKERQGAEVDA